MLNVRNRYANKGVVSLILPNELRPIAMKTKKPIDIIYNPFSVFSRMNLGQLLEGIVGKTVMTYDKIIKNQNLAPSELKDILNNLNNNVLKYLNNPEYCNRIQNEIINRLDDNTFAKTFVESIRETNLFIEAPAFSEVDTRSLLKHAVHPNEDVTISENTLKYIKDKIKLDITINGDIHLKNIFCAPIYTIKLYKIASHVISARDFGNTRAITRQPTKGRAAGGGSKLGQMEIEAILAHGTERAIKELITVKSDNTDEKKELLYQLTKDGEYNMPKGNLKSRTKDVVDVLIKFLKE